MKIHPRVETVRAAELTIMQALIDATHDLTTAESIQVINKVASDHIASICKHAIRAERHPDRPDYPGDAE